MLQAALRTLDALSTRRFSLLKAAFKAHGVAALRVQLGLTVEMIELVTAIVALDEGFHLNQN